jgi:DNA-binding response OmpR family regulator
MRLLIIEDEEDLAQALAKGLRSQGYAVDVALDGEQGCEATAVNDYDLLILDLNLPGIDGLEVCRRVRFTCPALLVLMLTARSDLDQRVLGLDTGADGYLAKPFYMKELSAQVRALLRRDLGARLTLLRHHDLTLDPATKIVRLSGSPVELTAKEYAVLELLMRNKHRIVSQEELLEHVWDGSVNCFTNTVRVHIGLIRRKLGDTADAPRYLETVVGRGYRMAAADVQDERKDVRNQAVRPAVP